MGHKGKEEHGDDVQKNYAITTTPCKDINLYEVGGCHPQKESRKRLAHVPLYWHPLQAWATCLFQSTASLIATNPSPYLCYTPAIIK